MVAIVDEVQLPMTTASVQSDSCQTRFYSAGQKWETTAIQSKIRIWYLSTIIP